jgi:LacI family transcriptional regulator
MTVTLLDIAKKVGVTPTTVSRVLRGKGSPIRASEETCHRVLAAAKEMNYFPSLTARSLVKGKTNTLGLLVGDIKSPSFSELASVVLKESEARGYHLVISVTEWDMKKELECFDLLIQRRVDGILMGTKAFTPGTRQFEYVLRQKFPVVTLARNIENFPSVLHDWRKGFEEALIFCREKGYRRIGFAGQAGVAPQTYTKWQVFLEACSAVQIEPVWYECSTQIEEARQFGRDFARREDRPQAIIVYSDFMAMGIIRGLRDEGLEVPKDQAVIGMDGTNLGEYSYLSLASIASDRRQMAVQAVDLLHEMIEKKDIIPQKVWIPTRFVPGESA